MSLLENYEITDSNSVEFKRKLIMQVKQHSCIWNNCYSHQRKDAWKAIEKEMGFLYTIKKLQTTWGSLRLIYFKNIFIRTIERNFEVPDWIFFHDLTFLYEFIKEKIQKKLGGISPPLFRPKQNANGYSSFRCPCCIYIEPDLNLESPTSSPKVKQNNEFGSIATEKSKTSFENNDSDEASEYSNSSVDFETVHSISSLDAEDIENQFCSLTNSPDLQQNNIQNSLAQSPSPDFMKDNTFGIIDLVDDTETSISVKSNDSDEINKYNEKDETEPKMSKVQLRAIERPKIIEAVKANPATYTRDPQKKNEVNLAWQKVHKEVGSLTLATLKNRWKLIRLRYLKELVCERYAKGTHISPWEYFEQLEFLRPYMQKDINEIHRTRLKIQESISRRAEGSNNVVKLTPRLNEPAIEDRTNELSSIKCIAGSTTDQPEFNDKNIVANVNKNQNIKIASVKTVKPNKRYCRQSKKIKKPVSLDKNTVPTLQNRKTFPSLDLTNEDDEDELSDNAEAPPPIKKLRKSTECREIKTLTNLSSPPSLNVALCADEATIEAAIIIQSEDLNPHKTQKVFPPLDLTLDDDPSVVVPKPSTSKFHQVFMEDLVHTDKLFPAFDLTTDEDNNQDKYASNENEIVSISNSGNEKNDTNVICLDDDSVSSYEEVIVYLHEEK